eukprot:659473-Lingulodinium_polyedra.AAC.1
MDKPGRGGLVAVATPSTRTDASRPKGSNRIGPSTRGNETRTDASIPEESNRIGPSASGTASRATAR